MAGQVLKDPEFPMLLEAQGKGGEGRPGQGRCGTLGAFPGSMAWQGAVLMEEVDGNEGGEEALRGRLGCGEKEEKEQTRSLQGLGGREATPRRE